MSKVKVSFRLQGLNILSTASSFRTPTLTYPTFQKYSLCSEHNQQGFIKRHSMTDWSQSQRQQSEVSSLTNSRNNKSSFAEKKDDDEDQKSREVELQLGEKKRYFYPGLHQQLVKQNAVKLKTTVKFPTNKTQRMKNNHDM